MNKKRNYAGLFFLFFIIALVGVNAWKAVGKENRQFLLDSPKIPLMRISESGTEVTDLRGYKSDAAQSYAKSMVVPIGKSKTLTISLGPDLKKVRSLSYKVVKKDDESLVADGTVSDFTQKDGYMTADMVMKDDLKENTDYLICFTANIPKQGKIYYYAQLVYGTNFHTEDNIQFIKKFHENVFAKSEDIINNIESELDASDNDFSHTTIKSSYNAIIFGNAEPQVEGDISYAMRKVNKTQATVDLTYIMSIQREERTKQYYRVVETYEVNYTQKRMQLLSYDREIESIFNPEFVYDSRQEILLGITQKEAPQYLQADSGRKICFVQGKQAWLYDYRKNTMTEIFAFGGDNTDLRSNLDQNNIKLLNMDDDGNIDFLVYGYMSRGEHEGQNGISLYHYDAASCLVKEQIFISSNYKYSALNKGIKKVAYLNEKGNLYMLLDTDLFKIDVDTSKVTKVEEDVKEDDITVSDSDQMVAIQRSDDKKNKKIDLWNLEKESKQKITCKDSQRIKMIGFLSEDFVYGIANQSDLPKSGSIFPMKRVQIVDTNGDKVKTYQKENRYILKVKISGNVIRVGLGKKKGSKYQKIPLQEYIRYQNSTTDTITFVRHSDTVQWSQLYIKFPSYVYVQSGGKMKKAGIIR